MDRFRRLACFACVLLLGAMPVWADNGSIEGKVVPEHDHAFTLATASLPDLAQETIVEADGTFRFDNVRPGTYVVVVRVPTLGVTSAVAEVTSGDTTNLEIPITPGSHTEEIVVSASVGASDPLDLATPTASLSGQELALRQEATLGETLAQEPGVSSTFFGPGASRPIIRGLSGDRIRVLEGGIDTGDAAGVSADHAVTTDPAQAERIEVLRGPATLLYGSSAIGGAVNVIDGRIPDTRASRPLGGSFEVSAGSVDDERKAAINLDGGQGDWAWHVDAVTREADDYEIPGFAALEGDEHDEHDDDEHEDEEHEEDEHDDDEHEEENSFGVVPNTDIETRAVRAGVTRFFGDKGFLGVSFSGFDTDYGLPAGLEHGEHEEEGEHDEHDEEGEHEEEEHDEEGEHDDDEHGEEPVRIDMEQRRIDLRGEILDSIGIFQGLRFRLGATDYEHVELEGEEPGTFFFNDFLETRLEFVQKQRQNHSGSVGLQYSDRDLEAIGAEAFIPKVNTERWALFTLQELQRGKTTWQFGARFEDQSASPSSAALSDRSHSGFSASVGLVWDFSDDWSVAASLARSVKLPAAEELFSNGPHVAAQAFEIGDPNLDEEVGLGFDLSLRKKTGRLTGEVTLFRQDFDDFIFQAFTGDEEDGFPVLLYSQADAELSGVEFKARVELLDRGGHHLHLRLVGDQVDAELDSGGYLPRIPPLRLGGGLHYHSEQWSATAEVRWVDDQNDVAVNETPTEGYTLVNASIGYRFLFQNRILDVLLRGRNLGDEEARNHSSLVKDFAPLPGRNVSLSLKLLF